MNSDEVKGYTYIGDGVYMKICEDGSVELKTQRSFVWHYIAIDLEMLATINSLVSRNKGEEENDSKQ